MTVGHHFHAETSNTSDLPQIISAVKLAHPDFDKTQHKKRIHTGPTKILLLASGHIRLFVGT